MYPRTSSEQKIANRSTKSLVNALFSEHSLKTAQKKKKKKTKKPYVVRI